MTSVEVWGTIDFSDVGGTITKTSGGWPILAKFSREVLSSRGRSITIDEVTGIIDITLANGRGIYRVESEAFGIITARRQYYEDS